jgi:hypothetical protein
VIGTPRPDLPFDVAGELFPKEEVRGGQVGPRSKTRSHQTQDIEEQGERHVKRVRR